MMEPHDEYISRSEVQYMIDEAIDKHNKSATMISAAIGSVLLFFYAHGVIAIIDRIR